MSDEKANEFLKCGYLKAEVFGFLIFFCALARNIIHSQVAIVDEHGSCHREIPTASRCHAMNFESEKRGFGMTL